MKTSDQSKRRLLKLVASAGAIASAKTLPESWKRPVVEGIVLPSHAETTTLTCSWPAGCISILSNNGTVIGSFDWPGGTGLQALSGHFGAPNCSGDGFSIPTNLGYLGTLEDAQTALALVCSGTTNVVPYLSIVPLISNPTSFDPPLPEDCNLYTCDLL